MLSQSDYLSYDATGLAELLHRGDVSARELVEAMAVALERLNPVLNAVVMLDIERALDAADAIDRTAAFAGVPFFAKDINVDVAGFRTTHACRYFAEAPVSEVDSALVRRWRAAGLVIAGRTNTPEFATDFGCEPEFYGPTANPWDLSRTPGGSSGGSAAAVAAGIVPMAHATDSGGSIRAPAACCGLFGFKPSSGRVETGSLLEPLVGGLNSDHAVTWTVRDSARLLDQTTQRGNEGDGHPYAAIDEPWHALRVGVVASAPGGQRPDTETEAKLAETTALLETLGHTVNAWEWPSDVNPFDTAVVFWTSELATMIDHRAAMVGRPPADGELGPLVQWAVDEARRTTAMDLVRARIRRNEIAQRVSDAMSDIDVLLTPVLTEPPLPTGLLTELGNQDVDAWAARAFGFAPYTEIFNVTGQPAMSVPLFQSSDGLPRGFQFAGHLGADRLLLKLARQLEVARPWFDRRPVLVV